MVPSLSRNLSDQWKHILPERAPFISKVTAVTPGQPFTVYYVLGQFARREGRVDVVADADLTLPDGKVDALFRQQTVYRGPDDGNGGLLSALRTQMVMEPEDQFGEYRVTVRFHDRNDGSRRTAEAKFRLEPLPEKFPPADLKRDAALIANYYRNPVPERLPGLLEAALKERPELTQKTLALYYGFGLLFRQNPQLWPELARIASAQRSDGRVSAPLSWSGCSARRGRRGAAAAQPGGPSPRGKDGGRAVAVAEVGNSTDLDRLWMEFFASGQVGPVRPSRRGACPVPGCAGARRIQSEKGEGGDDARRTWRR